jgi:hypothetical protein
VCNDTLLQLEAFSDDRFNLAFAEQIKQGVEVFPKPLRVLLLDSFDAVERQAPEILALPHL